MHVDDEVDGCHGDDEVDGCQGDKVLYQFLTLCKAMYGNGGDDWYTSGGKLYCFIVIMVIFYE